MIRFNARGEEIHAVKMREQFRECFRFAGLSCEFPPTTPCPSSAGQRPWNSPAIRRCGSRPGSGMAGRRRAWRGRRGCCRGRRESRFAVRGLPRSCIGAQILKLPVQLAEHDKDIAIQVLRVIRRAEVGVVVRSCSWSSKILGRICALRIVNVRWKQVAHRADKTVFHLPVHLLFILHRGGDAVDGRPRVRRRAVISALVARQRAVAKNVRPRDVAQGRNVEIIRLTGK